MADIPPQLKHVGFSLLLRFSSSSLTVRTVLREPITGFWRLSSPESCASVGISAPLACIPVCMQWGYCLQSVPLHRLRNGDIPNLMLKSLRINRCMGIFTHDFLTFSQGGVSCLNFNAITRYIGSHSS